MADFRPFRALRYRTPVADDIASLVAPPYDVIDAAEQSALHERSPYNVVRLELGESRTDDGERANKYTRAAAALSAWRSAGVLAQDEAPAFYEYVLEFEHEGTYCRRRHIFGLLRLEPWEAGEIRPHEETMAKPKEDRLQLLRHLRANVSPVFVVARRTIVSGSTSSELLIDMMTPDSQRHALSAIHQTEAIIKALREQALYILDGHHRYETALAYRDECRAHAANWTGEEPENFVLAAVTAVDDPGLLCLPTHRLVQPPVPAPDAIERLARYFDVTDTTPKSYNGTALLRLLARVSAAGVTGTAFGALGLEEGRLHLLTLRDAAAVRALMPAGSHVWKSLEVNVLEHAVLRNTLGITAGKGAVEYTQDASRAMRDVEAGRWPLAFLLNATKVEQMLAVADAGEKMPAKSTYFYPKLPTGLVLHAFD